MCWFHSSLCVGFILLCVYMKDLAENGIEIELMHIGSSFDASAFYKVSGWVDGY